MAYELYTDNGELLDSEKCYGKYPTLLAAVNRVSEILAEYNGEAEGAYDDEKWVISSGDNFDEHGNLLIHTRLLCNGLDHHEVFTIVHVENA